jgi:hypothetical protein
MLQVSRNELPSMPPRFQYSAKGDGPLGPSDSRAKKAQSEKKPPGTPPTQSSGGKK